MVYNLALSVTTVTLSLGVTLSGRYCFSLLFQGHLNLSSEFDVLQRQVYILLTDSNGITTKYSWINHYSVNIKGLITISVIQATIMKHEARPF